MVRQWDRLRRSWGNRWMVKVVAATKSLRRDNLWTATPTSKPWPKTSRLQREDQPPDRRTQTRKESAATVERKIGLKDRGRSSNLKIQSVTRPTETIQELPTSKEMPHRYLNSLRRIRIKRSRRSSRLRPTRWPPSLRTYRWRLQTLRQ